eukprot:2616415-Pleurochrysis_carterae.AAC.2
MRSQLAHRHTGVAHANMDALGTANQGTFLSVSKHGNVRTNGVRKRHRANLAVARGADDCRRGASDCASTRNTHTHTHTHTHTRTRIHTNTHRRTHTRTHAHARTHTQTHAHTNARARARTYVSIHTRQGGEGAQDTAHSNELSHRRLRAAVEG